MTFQKLKNKFQSHSGKVGILGLGYVGLPLACEFANVGFSVTGFEVDASKVKSLLAGKSYIGDIESQEIRELTGTKRLTATTDFDKLRGMDAIIVCVPTPLNKTKDPDISYIDQATHKIARTLHSGQLVVLESTTYPGTTRDNVLPILESKNLKVGKDFYLAFSPERIDPGNKQFKLPNTPKVVGGITSNCKDLAVILYSQIVKQVIPVSSAEAAEMTKILENTFRAVNIGLVNEIMMICDKLGLSAWEVIEAASTKPYGFMPFYPGPGLGGHCIPIDPHYLSWKMKSLNFAARFIELAGEINSHMPDFTVNKIMRTLNHHKKSINGSKILVLGVAYKANVSDMRESPALDVIHLLQQMGADVSFHDPHVPWIIVDHHKMSSRPYSTQFLKHFDAVVITTAHSAFNPKEILEHSKLVIDTRNMLRGLKADHLVRL
jgi:UDP-N-acetyl-D-glucosamine dehydrogenase